MARKKPVNQRYMKIPPFVQAAQVTKANVADVAAWCGGTVVRGDAGQVGVTVPKIPPPHNKAWAGSLDYETEGDFVVQDSGSDTFRVAQGNAFTATYVPAPENP